MAERFRLHEADELLWAAAELGINLTPGSLRAQGEPDPCRGSLTRPVTARTRVFPVDDPDRYEAGDVCRLTETGEVFLVLGKRKPGLRVERAIGDVKALPAAGGILLIGNKDS